MKEKNKNLIIYKKSIFNFDKFAANILFKKITNLLKTSQKQLNIALSGGNTPLSILELLREKKVDWERINFFLVDERCVPNTDFKSNYGNIKSHFFDYVPSRSFPVIHPRLSYCKLAEKYEAKIKKYVNIVDGLPQFDLIVLGMGLDGHTASLFPKTKALEENKKWVVLNHVPQLNTKRITMTYPLILNSKKIILLIKGSKKREIINNKLNKNLPIHKIIPFIDIILN